jgi:hypothetical protein
VTPIFDLDILLVPHNRKDTGFRTDSMKKDNSPKEMEKLPPVVEKLGRRGGLSKNWDYCQVKTTCTVQ